ncbi:WXG100 family type VII secretion target [Nocardia sp. NPDC058658]|uniref:WXG100 family type VII secretion target n=1 Tax=Nocardia sp. NPDC058658 TaxID=3346580 RepID=UPI00365559DC
MTKELIMPFQANAGEISDFATKVMKPKHDEINAMIRASEDRANAVAESNSFKGSAGGAFQNVMLEYLKSARALNEALMTNAENVGSVAVKIDDQEARAAQEMMAAPQKLNM